ncbi:hypothetical protein ERO13_D13G079650v2 [Gossypium hirsutum]|nr:hypothetical protein ERO13_D13G079650v2 [Gossypium hirsutum]PPD98053.1 hypothetical protein GOBAR_DD04920 [Gossypium barbadense]TYG36824.1 hypothetical protein ES288_D13G094400v1 [Gossypium darwinii]TYH33946.1 hypothetical protein ES332_D13G094600v1 [Gossypium tomentosum]
MDLRYCIPPVLNLVLFLFLSPSNSEGGSSIFFQNFSIMELPFLLLALFFLLVFLFTSADVPFKVNLIHFRPRDFSIDVTASLLVSLFYPPSLFWSFHFFLLVSYPCHGLFFDLFKQLLCWFYGVCQSLPTYVIGIVPSNEENPSSRPPLHV